VAEGVWQVDGEELTGRQTITMRAWARVDQDAVHRLPTGEADLIVRGLAERVRMFRTRVPAAVETVAQSLTAPPIAGTLHPSTRDGAGLVRDADWSRATAPLTGTSSGQIGPPGSRQPPPKVSGPRTPILPLCPPSPARLRRAPPVSPPEPLGRTPINVAAHTGCRMCHRSPAEGDLRHTSGLQVSRQSASGLRSRMASES
jgi:hypothetical protein